MTDAFSPNPIDEVDARAREAFQAYCDLLPSLDVIRRLDIDPRTLQRIYNEKRYLPPGLARDAADHLQEALDTGAITGPPVTVAMMAIDKLRAWADRRSSS